MTLTRCLQLLLIFQVLPTMAQDDLALLESRMAGLSGAMDTEVAFEETRSSELFEQPLVATGRLLYDPASGAMTKLVESPEPARMTVTDEDIEVESGDRRRRISLRKRPELSALLNGFRGMIEGDLELLRRHFELDYSEQEGHWELRLVPRSRRLARRVELLIVAGVGDRVSSICTRMDNGDWQHLALKPDGP